MRRYRGEEIHINDDYYVTSDGELFRKEIKGLKHKFVKGKKEGWRIEEQEIYRLIATGEIEDLIEGVEDGRIA